MRFIDSPTYDDVSSSEESVIHSLTNFLDRIGVNVTASQRKLPFIYAIPKLYKNPSKLRHIISSRNSIITLICKISHIILKHYRNFLHSYCSKILHRTGQNRFHSIKSNHDLPNFINFNKHRINKAATADFSNLFTSLPNSYI